MRRLLLWASRDPWLRAHVPQWRWVKRAVRRFMPGETLDDAIAAATTQQAAGVGSLFTLLGENLTSLAEGDAVAAHYHEVLARTKAAGLATEISVKLTQLGFDLDPKHAERLFRELALAAGEAGTWAWIDMEGSDYVEATVACYERVKADHPNTGLAMQAYLHRTPADVERLLPLRPAIRLVKGAYDEPATIAYRRGADVDAAYLGVTVAMIKGAAAGSVSRCVLGTHDTELIAQAARHAEANGLDRAKVEVHMLYGIRADQQRRLAREGFTVKTLVAYGTFWYPWYVRRLAERPANLLFAVRQILP
jgi:proline dehydrogenase